MTRAPRSAGGVYAGAEHDVRHDAERVHHLDHTDVRRSTPIYRFAPYSSHRVAIARMPSLKFSSLIHSSGACAFSPGNPNPTNSTGAPNIRSKSPTTGMEPPSPVITGSFPNAARNAPRAAS